MHLLIYVSPTIFQALISRSKILTLTEQRLNYRFGILQAKNGSERSQLLTSAEHKAFYLYTMSRTVVRSSLIRNWISQIQQHADVHVNKVCPVG